MQEPRPPKLYKYRLPGGWEVWAGKTDDDNDQLSLRLARANDWWFHVRGMPGSHVVLRVEDIEPDRTVLDQAAAVAAYHSKAREGGRVAVSGTLAKNVTKPKGSKSGTVQIKRERVFKVKPAQPEEAV